MKRFGLTIIIFFALLSFLPAGCAHSPNGELKTYTSHNLWYSRGRNLAYAINYQKGNILPPGTEVTDIRMFPNADRLSKEDINYRKYPYILFKSLDPRGWIEVRYQHKFHPERSMQDYADLIFTNQSFSELTEGMTEKEINAIGQGVIVEGMSKKAVIMSLGLPSDHKTPDLEANQWFYWKSRMRKHKVCFNADSLTISCKRKKQIIEKLL